MKDWYRQDQHDVEYKLLVERLTITDNLILDEKPAVSRRINLCDTGAVHIFKNNELKLEHRVKGR